MRVCERQPHVAMWTVCVVQVATFIVVLNVPEKVNSSPTHEHVVHGTAFMNNKTDAHKVHDSVHAVADLKQDVTALP